MSSLSHLFTRSLLEANPVMAARFREWDWMAGMGFQDDNLWWGEGKKRISLHEGVDFVRYRDRNGKRRNLDCGVAVPSVFAGEIVRFHRDFLAWSLYIRHAQFVKSDRVLYSVFGHLQPSKKAYVGQPVGAGEVVGFLEKYRRNSSVPLHLHFTVAWISRRVPPEDLDWQLLGDCGRVILVDPLGMRNK